MKKPLGGNEKPPLQIVADFVFHGGGKALSTAEKLTAFAIASHTNRASGRTDPSDERIAQVSGLNVRTVRRAIPNLAGLFSFERGGSDRGETRRATSYRLRATPDTTPTVRPNDPGHSVRRPRTFTPRDPGHHVLLTKEGNQGTEPRSGTDAERRTVDLARLSRRVDSHRLPVFPGARRA